MKKYIAFLIIIMATLSCSTSNNAQQNPDTAISQLEYKAYTRGSNKEVVVTRDKIKVNEVRMGKNIEAAYPLSKNDWNKLAGLAGNIKLDKMESLEAPSKKHQFDGAMAANLIINNGATTYNSVTIDDGNPPTALKALVDEIIGLSGVGKIQVQE